MLVQFVAVPNTSFW